MKKIAIGELKKNFSRYIDRVKNGESILVLSRNQPVARIVPLQAVTRGIASSQERLARLERRALIRRGTGDPEKWLANRRPTEVGAGILKDLLDERRELNMRLATFKTKLWKRKFKQIGDLRRSDDLEES